MFEIPRLEKGREKMNVRRRRFFSAFFVLLVAPAVFAAGGLGQANRTRVRPGLELFLDEYLHLVKGKKVGLLTNPSGVDANLKSDVEILARQAGVNLVALYGPEHGHGGQAQAGESVSYTIDRQFNIPVFSLYGQAGKSPSGWQKNVDEKMRSFDTKSEGKIPEGDMLQKIDVMIYDIQDVGTRVYTYISSMAYAMQSCAELGVEFIVLDRPNPITGSIMEGPVLDYPRYSSFVGLYPIPLRHGMTAGELAKLFNDRFLEKKVALTVIPMKGWKREMWYDQSNLPWVLPSPNMPTLETATVYPGQVFLEGTNVSEGRGTTKPFELFGAPWIDGYELTRKLNELGLPGVQFREAWFRPTFSKFQGEACRGAQVHVTDRSVFRPLAMTLHIIKTILELYPDKFQFQEDYFDKIMGTDKVRKALLQGESVRGIIRGFEKGLEEFGALRRPYLLY
jgi:uncharacterized protein YbbC (DUF1343 family)